MKRKQNENRKNKRAASWFRGQERKQKRREENARQAGENLVRRAQGELTPWQVAKAKRRALRGRRAA